MVAAILLAAAVAAALVITYMGATFILYDPNRRPHKDTPATFGLGYENVEFRNPDGQLLKGWIVPAKAPKSPRRTIFLIHGWGTNKSFILDSTHFLAEKGGYDLFYFDTRACGESEGKRSTIGYLEALDADAAFDFLRRRRPEMLMRLGLWGRSMGGAVGVYQAARQPEVRAAVIEASFGSFEEIVSRWVNVKTLVPDFPLIPITKAWVRLRLGADPEPYSPIHHVRHLDGKPMFYIQGDDDWLMQVSEAERLYRMTPGPKDLWIVQGADHDHCRSVAPEEYERRVLAFYDKNL